MESNIGSEDSPHQPEPGTNQQRLGQEENNIDDVPLGNICLPTSEVGFGPNLTSQTNVFPLLEQQNRNFLELVKQIQRPASELQTTSEICLPKYNPDVAAVDATQWCATVDIILREKPLADSALILALTKVLEGGAEQWLSQICYPGITWQQFRQLFEQRYETSETLAAAILNFLGSRPSNGESLLVYASRKTT